MATITGDKDAVRRLMEQTIHELETGGDGAPSRAGARTTRVRKMARAGMTATADAGAAATDHTTVLALREALARVDGDVATPKRGTTRALGAKKTREAAINERGVKSSYAPRDQKIALFQSAMDTYLKNNGVDGGGGGGDAKTKSRNPGMRATAVKTKVTDPLALFQRPDAAKKGKGLTARKRGIGAQFGRLDPRWVEVVKEKFKVLFKGKRPFVVHKKTEDFRYDLANQATIAIVGDWGGGNTAAQSVAKRIAALKVNHVIHLGDVYYAGTPEEVRDRFLKCWPTPSEPGRSFALNSNHEMYSGGYGYFDLTLKTFKQPASYFSLANDNWRFVGLDTGYDEHDLHAPQAEWLAAQLDDHPKRKTVLLSHHQLFSLYEKTNTSKLEAKVQSMLGRLYGWIWGHEHLAVVYEPKDGLRAICLGNGCFPYVLPAKKPVGVKWIDRHASTDSHFNGGHTFAVLKLDGPAIDIEFFDENGKSVNREEWR